MASKGNAPNYQSLETYVFDKYPTRLDTLDWAFVYESDDITPHLIRFLVSDSAAAKYVDWKSLCANANLTAELMIEFIAQGKPLDYNVLATHANLTTEVLDELRKHDDLRNQYGLAFMETLDGRAQSQTFIKSDVSGSDLHCAVYHGKIECVKLLLSDKSIDLKDYAPFEIKCADRDILEMLVSRGAKFTEKTKQSIWFTELMPAIQARQNWWSVACRKDIKAWTAALDAGVSVDQINPCGDITTPMHYAVIHGQEFVSLLLARGANPNAADSRGQTPIFKATTVEMVKFLLNHNAAVNTYDKNGCTVLHEMASNTKTVPSILRLLIRRGVDVEAIDKNLNETALFYAARSGSDQHVLELLDAGVNVNARNKHGWTSLLTALHKFYQHDKSEYKAQRIRHLYNYGGNLGDVTINDNIKRMLFVYKQYCSGSFISSEFNGFLTSSLLKRLYCISTYKQQSKDDAQVNGPDNVGHWIPLMVAVDLYRIDILQLLIDNGAEVNLVCSKNRSVLHRAAICCMVPEVIQFLLEQGCDPNAADIFDITPLTLAAQHELCHPQSIELLIKFGANVNAKNHIGNTALHKAAKFGRLEIMETLLTHGADINAKNTCGETPLDCLLRSFSGGSRYRTECVSYLLSRGARVTKKYANLPGKVQDIMATHEAQEKLSFLNAVATGNVDQVSNYLASGGNPNVADKFGKSALMIAVWLSNDGRNEIVDLLLSYGADVTVKDNDGKTALHLVNDNLDMASRLIKLGADVNAKMTDGYTPFSLHFCFGSKMDLKFWIDNGADLNAITIDGSILQMACLYCDPIRVDYLLDCGANPNLIVNGLSALDIVCSDALEHKPISAKIMAMMVFSKYRPATRTDKYRAAIIKSLIHYGADFSSRSFMKLVGQPGSIKSIKQLLKSGRKRRPIEFQNALHIACSYGNLDVVQLLIIEGFDVNSIDTNGARPIDLCQKYPAIVTLLQQHRVVKITKKNYPDWFDYVTSVRDGRVDEVEKHLDNGANVDFIYNRCPMLHHAIIREKIKVARLLIKRGANVGIIKPCVANALHVAVAFRADLKLIKLLLKAGANPFERQIDDYKTAVECLRNYTSCLPDYQRNVLLLFLNYS